MIIVEEKEEIRRAYYIEGKSIRQIHRETGHHRRTIRKALGDGMKPEYKRRESHSRPVRPVMGPVEDIIDQWLEKDKTQPLKQRHTAKRIYERLKGEYGFGGFVLWLSRRKEAESTVRYYKAAVNKVLKGRDREEQVAFIAFRSHYLFESRFCTPAAAHEKGLVEGLVGYSRRNFLVPMPEQDTWDDLNSYLWEKCKAESPRRLRGMQMTIGHALALEQPKLLPLPSRPFPCCTLHPVRAICCVNCVYPPWQPTMPGLLKKLARVDNAMRNICWHS